MGLLLIPAIERIAVIWNGRSAAYILKRRIGKSLRIRFGVNNGRSRFKRSRYKRDLQGCGGPFGLRGLLWGQLVWLGIARRDQAVGKGVGGSLGAVFQLKFFEDVFEVGFDGIDGNGQFFCDLLVAGSAGHQTQHE